MITIIFLALIFIFLTSLFFCNKEEQDYQTKKAESLKGPKPPVHFNCRCVSCPTT